MHFLRDLSLAGFNSFGVSANARWFANVSSEVALMDWCAAHGRETPPFLIGGGSNLLLTQDIEAPVLQIAPRGARIVWDEGSTVLVEAMFNWPGLSTLLVDAVAKRDYPMVQGTVLTIAALFIFINLGVELLYSLLDPRIRRRGA